MVDAPSSPESSEAADRVDDLRRRLYRVDASEEDLQRYLAEQPVQPAVEPIEEVSGDGVKRFPRRRTGIALAVVMTAAAVLIVQGARSPTGSAGPTALPAGQALLQSIGDGQVLDVAGGEVTDAVNVPAAVHGTAVAGQRFSGRGNALVAFHPPSGAFDGGTLMVAMTATGSAPVRWRALLVMTRNETTSYPLVLARGRVDRESGLGVPTTFIYPSRPPTRFAVAAAPDVRWTLVVAVTNGVEPALH